MARFPFYVPPTGYAIPGYVQREGLQSRAFVTKWAPRGTYDDPDAYDPSWDKSYAQPGYVMAEGYGQGAKVTEWAPRGSYVGFAGKGLDHPATKLPASYERFGNKAAQVVISRVASLPVESRQPTLKRILGKIDPTLYSRAAAHTAHYQRQGATKAQAVHAGLARAMASGMAKEVVQVGKSGRPPKAGSLLGLGCYGLTCLAGDGGLGAVPSLMNQLASGVSGAGVRPQSSTCPGYTWDGTTNSWRRTMAGGTDVAGPAGVLCPGAGQAGITGATTTGAPVTDDHGILIGPWVYPVNGATLRVHYASLPADWVTWFKTNLKYGADTGLAKAAASGAYGSMFNSMKPVVIDGAIVGLPGTKITVINSAVNGMMPIAKVTHPVKNEEWGLYISAVQPDGAFSLTFKKVEKNWLERAWDWIVHLVGKLVDLVKDVVNAVGNLACTILSSPGAAQAGAAAGAIEGGPAGAAAGANGAQIAQSACGQPPPGGGGGGGGGDLVPILIAGGVVVAAVLLTSKKAKKVTP